MCTYIHKYIYIYITYLYIYIYISITIIARKHILRRHHHQAAERLRRDGQARAEVWVDEAGLTHPLILRYEGNTYDVSCCVTNIIV